ncbi:putative neck protein [Vibrio phage 236O40-1]|nr:putative neck protein [Vibrio phage 236O40-1]
MLEIEINLGDDFLEANVKAFESQRVRVGVLDEFQMAAIPAKVESRGLKTLRGTGEKARKIKTRSKTLSLRQLAVYLDARYGVFTDAINNANNLDLNQVTQEMIKAFTGGDVEKRRIENAAIALIRNPIMRKDFGSNMRETSRAKTFDWPMVDTGTFFLNIKAEYLR